MNTAWKDIKRSVYALLFADAADEAEYEPYLYDAANYALMEAARFVRPLTAKVCISHFPLENVLCGTAGYEVYAHQSEDIVFKADCARSYYFECDGNGTAVFKDGKNRTLLKLELNAQRKFRAYRGFLDAQDGCELIFTGGYEYRVKNIAFYKSSYGPHTEDIPAYGHYSVYDLDKMTRDEDGRRFMSFAQDFPVVKVSAGGLYEDYCEFKNYLIQNGTHLCLPRSDAGEFEVYYKRYPTKITRQTPDHEVLEIAPEAAQLIPLLMAWRLLKQDDERAAALYYNEYQEAKEEISAAVPSVLISPAQIWGGERTL